MRSSKLGLRAIGLAILGALSLTAFFAASAQAQLPGESTAGSFQINGGAALLATATGEQEGTGFLLVQGRNLKISCTTGKVAEGSEIISSTQGLAKVLFEGCTATSHAGAALPCTVLSPGETTGNVAATALALPILHGGKNFVLFEPDGTLNFAEVELHGATCPLPLVNPVKGAVVAEVIENNVVEPLITFSEAIQLLSGDKLTFGGFPAYINASAKVKLTGKHENLTLGVI